MQYYQLKVATVKSRPIIVKLTSEDVEAVEQILLEVEDQQSMDRESDITNRLITLAGGRMLPTEFLAFEPESNIGRPWAKRWAVVEKVRARFTVLCRAAGISDETILKEIDNGYPYPGADRVYCTPGVFVPGSAAYENGA